MGAPPLQPRWRWPLYAAVGFNLVLIAAGLIVHGTLGVNSDSSGGVIFVWFADVFLIVAAIIGLVGSLAVMALVNLYERRGGRWLLAARIVAGLIAGLALSSLAAFVGVILLPTAAAVVAGCITRPSGDPTLAGRWFPAATE